jgi:hypothetical protein
MSAFLEVLTATCSGLPCLVVIAQASSPASASRFRRGPVFVGSCAARNGAKKAKSGAVALEEPKEDNPADAYPPREL